MTNLNESIKIFQDFFKNDNVLDNILVENIDENDYPDFCDAYIESADLNGLSLTMDELEVLNEDSNFIYEQVIKQIF